MLADITVRLRTESVGNQVRYNPILKYENTNNNWLSSIYFIVQVSAGNFSVVHWTWLQLQCPKHFLS